MRELNPPALHSDSVATTPCSPIGHKLVIPYWSTLLESSFLHDRVRTYYTCLSDESLSIGVHVNVLRYSDPIEKESNLHSLRFIQLSYSVIIKSAGWDRTTISRVLPITPSQVIGLITPDYGNWWSVTYHIEIHYGIRTLRPASGLQTDPLAIGN